MAPRRRILVGALSALALPALAGVAYATSQSVSDTPAPKSILPMETVATTPETAPSVTVVTGPSATTAATTRTSTPATTPSSTPSTAPRTGGTEGTTQSTTDTSIDDDDQATHDLDDDNPGDRSGRGSSGSGGSDDD